MKIQQEHLPQEKDATREEEWGFTIWEFIEGNILYILGILLILGIFLYARSYMRKNK